MIYRMSWQEVTGLCMTFFGVVLWAVGMLVLILGKAGQWMLKP